MQHRIFYVESVITNNSVICVQCLFFMQRFDVNGIGTQRKIYDNIQCFNIKIIFFCLQLLPNFTIHQLSVGHPVCRYFHVSRSGLIEFGSSIDRITRARSC